VQVDDELLLLVGEHSSLQVGPQVVGPPQPAALPAPQQPCERRPHESGEDRSIASKH
jgi:hypothetical protein